VTSPPDPRQLIGLSQISEGTCLATTDLPGVRAQLGPGVLEEFCRCFIHLDRLLSLRALGYYSEKAATAVGKRRDFQTSIWMMLGTLKELGTAFGGLRTALRKAGRFENDAEWAEVQEIVDLSKNERRIIRNDAAFHVTPEFVEKGLNSMAATGKPVIFAVTASKDDLGFSFSLAAESLFAALDMTKEESDRFMKSLLGDVDRVSRLLPEIFVKTIRRAGLVIPKV
jgi:hypothetical protein